MHKALLNWFNKSSHTVCFPQTGNIIDGNPTYNERKPQQKYEVGAECIFEPIFFINQ